MIELTKYFPAAELDLAWAMEKDIQFLSTPGEVSQIMAYRTARAIAECNLMPQRERVITLSATKILGMFLKQGPVIIRPKLTLCHALIDTAVNFHIEHYHQPFQIIGVDLPVEILGPNGPSMAFVHHQPGPVNELIVWYRSRFDQCTYHIQIGGDLPTIEDRLQHMEWADTAEEAQLFHRVCRIAINACLLAATRQTAVTKLHKNVVNRRRRGDERIRQVAARECQEIMYRDLVIYDRTASGPAQKGTGTPQGKQHRRGHWKNVAHGPGFSMHRLDWINDYYTHKESDAEQPTVVMK